MKEKKTTLVGWGPTNEEEAIARIEAIEADIEKTRPKSMMENRGRNSGS